MDSEADQLVFFDWIDGSAIVHNFDFHVDNLEFWGSGWSGFTTYLNADGDVIITEGSDYGDDTITLVSPSNYGGEQF